jgi:hypothetical protein
MAMFEFFGHFFFSNGVFKLQENFSEHGIREWTSKFPDISYFTDFRQTKGAEKISKKVLSNFALEN